MESFKGLSGSFYDITRVAHGGNHIIRPKKNKINCILDSNHKLSDGIDYFWILLVPLSLFQPFFILIRNPPHSTKNNFHQTKSSTPPETINYPANRQIQKSFSHQSIKKITLQWLLESFISILYVMTSLTRFGFGHFRTSQWNPKWPYRVHVPN